MTITADGGWLTAILLIGLLVVGIMAYRKRWPARRRAFVAVGDSTTKEERKESEQKKEKHSGGHEKKHSFSVGTLLMWLIIIALAIYIIFHLPAIIDGFFRLAGIKVVQPAPVATRQYPVAVPIPAPKEQSQTYTIKLEDCGCEMPRWVRIPDGYRLDYTVDGLPADNQTIGTQCSSALEEPPLDATGEAYWCSSSAIGRWWRPYIYQHAERTAVVHYHFQQL